MRGYCFDTDTLSAVVRRDPPLLLIRRVATVPPEAQFTTAITLGELLYGVARRGSTELSKRVHRLVDGSVAVLPFDRSAAETYGWLRAELESAGTRLAEPHLRIASIAIAGDLTLVSGNVRHFGEVPGLQLENWLEG